jgi:hypothetical protein
MSAGDDELPANNEPQIEQVRLPGVKRRAPNGISALPFAAIVLCTTFKLCTAVATIPESLFFEMHELEIVTFVLLIESITYTPAALLFEIEDLLMNIFEQ